MRRRYYGSLGTLMGGSPYSRWKAGLGAFDPDAFNWVQQVPNAPATPAGGGLVSSITGGLSKIVGGITGAFTGGGGNPLSPVQKGIIGAAQFQPVSPGPSPFAPHPSVQAPSSGLSTTTMLLLGAAGLGAVYLLTRKSGPRTNPVRYPEIHRRIRLRKAQSSRRPRPKLNPRRKRRHSRR